MSSLVDERPKLTEGPFPRGLPNRQPSGEDEIWVAAPSGHALRAPSRTGDWSDSYVCTIQPLVGRMLALAQRILGDEPQAWDAVQEAMIALWGKGEKPTNLQAWLTSTVILRSLHLARSRARRRRHERRACQRMPEATTRDAPTSRIEHAELSLILDEALQKLPPSHAEVLLLRSTSGMDYGEIAEFLNLPIGTVRSRLNRGRRTIQATLSEKFPPDGE